MNLEGLNKQQQEAVMHGEGPCLVLAGAGAGKTAVLTRRAARLIEEVGVPPARVLLFTFTRKAADEMRTRLAAMVGEERAQAAWIGTFHSTCLRILKISLHELGETKFDVLPPGRTTRLARDILAPADDKHPYGMDWATDPKALLSTISRAKVDLVDVDGAERWLRENTDLDDEVDRVVEFWRRYEDAKAKAEPRLFDFDDFLLRAWQMFTAHPEVLARWQGAWDYILEDEVQDTNFAQHEICRMLAATHNNYFCVGDVNQCVTEGTLIRTPLGQVPVEQLEQGDFVSCGVGRGKTGSAVVTDIYRKEYDGTAIRITTASGKTVTTTPEHIHFAAYPVSLKKQRYFVYLMQREDLGFRVGITSYVAGGNSARMRRYGQRLNQEQADAMWLLDACETSEEARYLEQFYSVKYGLPTWIFRGGVASCRDEDIKRLFDSLPTEASARRLLADKDMFLDWPHHRPKCMNVRRRRNFSITILGDSRGNNIFHRYSIAGSDDADRAVMTQLGLPVKDAKSRGWAAEACHKDLGAVYAVLERVRARMPVNVIEKAALGGATALSLTPASHVLPGMNIFVADERGRVVVDQVETVERIPYRGQVFDINVDRFHNFVADGVVTHNSIYGFHGSRPEHTVMSFEADYPLGTIIKLPINYRSQSQIVEMGARLIKHNPMPAAYSLIQQPHREAGAEPHLFVPSDEDDEAEQIARMIERDIHDGRAYRDAAILYRINAQSRAVEDAMIRHEIPYVVHGSCGFYDRREVKDILAFVQLAFNAKCEAGDEALARVINIPTTWYVKQHGGKMTHFLGNAFLRELETIATRRGCSMWEALSAGSWKQWQWDSIYDVRDYVDAVRRAGVEPHLMIAAARLKGYDDWLLREQGQEDEEDDGTRAENLDQLVQAASKFDNAGALLDYVTQQRSRAKKVKEGADVVQLLTIHRSKGLEWPVVYVCGLAKGLLPHRRSIKYFDPLTKLHIIPESIEEERRLAYVAVTRTMDQVHVSALQGYQMYCLEESPFLAEMGFARPVEYDGGAGLDLDFDYEMEAG